jgi:crossover junction endodeoxyribonuclease RuvC
MDVLGVDPGLSVTGYAVVRALNGRVSILDAGVCRTSTNKSLAARLAQIECDLAELLSQHSPTLMAVEKLYAHYRHPRTAVMMGHARGVILSVAGRQSIEVRGYSATQVKRFLTGNGRATKAQMQRAVMRELDLRTVPDPADVADALAVALCCAHEANAKAGRVRTSYLVHRASGDRVVLA